MYNYEELYELFSSNVILSRVGIKEENPISTYPIMYVDSLEEMRKGMDSLKWENTINEEGNELRLTFIDSGRDNILTEFNNQIKETKEKYIFSLQDHIIEILKDKSMTENTYIDIRGDMIVLFKYSFYRDYYTCDFAEAMLDIYKSGHIPCGYKGRFRKGSILVY